MPQAQQAASRCYALEIRPYNVGDNVEPRDRPGRDRRQPAADGDRLLDDRHRRPRAAPAPRPRGPGPHRAASCSASTRGAARKVKIDPAYRQAHHGRPRARRAGAAAARRRTSSPGWPHSRLPVFGKTGTAEVPSTGLVDQSWYVAYVPHKTQADRRSRRRSSAAASAPTAPRRSCAGCLRELVRPGASASARPPRPSRGRPRTDGHARPILDPQERAPAAAPARAAARACCAHRPDPAARRRSACARLLGRRDRRDDAGRARLAPGRLHRRSASCVDARRQPGRLLAAARAEVRPLRR